MNQLAKETLRFLGSRNLQDYSRSKCTWKSPFEGNNAYRFWGGKRHFFMLKTHTHAEMQGLRVNNKNIMLLAAKLWTQQINVFALVRQMQSSIGFLLTPLENSGVPGVWIWRSF